MAVSLGLAEVAVHEPQTRLRWLAGLCLLWALPSQGARAWLDYSWDLSAGSLVAASGAPPAAGAPEVAVAVLAPARAPRWESRRLAEAGIELSPSGLAAIDAYLQARGFRSLYRAEVVLALRAGRLLRWEADAAIDAHALLRPGLVVPDYRRALALLRAGPLTPERFLRLERLSEQARSSRQGFGQVTQSQYIFEAFSAAYARFGEDEPARAWLGKIDDLWPLYEKKVEVPRVETPLGGMISGAVLVGGEPAAGLGVGLFFVAGSTLASPALEDLSGAAETDAHGSFRFSDLGSGRYYLALRAPAPLAGAALSGVPGFITLSRSRRSAVLASIDLRLH